MSSEKHALIIGAGLSGLATALALKQHGWQVTLFEQAKEHRGIGAGIVLAANAMKALDKLGVGQEVRRLGAAVRSARIRDWKGNLLVELPVTEQALRYGADSFLIHRADLQQALLANLSAEELVLGKQLASFSQEAWGVQAVFADGTSASGDILIGADGIHSRVRTTLFGNEKMRYAGYTAIRGIAHYADARYPVESGGGFEAWGSGLRFGFSHIGNNRIHWFAAINAPEGEADGPLGRKQETLRRLDGWYEPVRAVIEATEETAILRHDIYDRAPLQRWSDGRITLVGDAAHPMLPNLGQGAGQGLEDALVLARCLTLEGDDLVRALRQYEVQRKKRANAIVKGSRMMGFVTQWENPVAIAARNLMLRTIPARIQSRRLDWIVGHEV